MNAEIVNLRLARKRRKRADDAKQAEKNRFEFGRSKRERKSAKDANSRTESALDAKRLEPSASGGKARPGAPGDER